MELDGIVQALQADLAAVAALGDEASADAARRIALSLGPALRMRLLDALGEAAAELGPQLASGHVEVRLAGREPSLVYVEDAGSEPAPADDALSARITLRLPEALKAAVEAAAALEGVSANTWLVRAIARSVDRPRRAATRRLTGFGRS